MKTIPNEPISPIIVDGAGPEGLTKREYFAVLTLQGFLAGKNSEVLPYEMIVKHAVIVADFLIVELNKNQQKEIK